MSLEQGNLISLEQLAQRQASIRNVEERFPTEVIDGHHSFDRLMNLTVQGLGIVVTITHFCRDDILRCLAALLKNQALERKRIVMAMGLHEYGAYQTFAGTTGADIFPVTTQGTIDTLGKEAPALGTGMEEFMVKAVDALNQGDLVMMVPQGGRRSRLTRSEGRILQTLFADAADRDIRFGILFSGIGIKGKGDYTNREYHYNEPFILRLGRVYTDEELLTVIDGDSRSQKMRKIDAFWQSQTGLLVPEDYC